MRDNQDSLFGTNKSLERWLSAALDRATAADAADFGAKPLSRAKANLSRDHLLGN
jgi:hypothetical protein